MTSATYSRIEQKPIGGTPGGSSSNQTNHRANAASATARTGFKGHAFTVAVLLAFGPLPLVLYFSVVANPFTPKPVVCGRRKTFLYGEDDVASKTTGAQSIFTIGHVPSQALPFWLAKLIDTAWDLFVARGMQFLASAISYVALSNSLLRPIESSPVPYRTFAGISVNGASARTVISLLQDLSRHSRQRTAFLFAFSALAIVYVLAVPTLLSTMTGYISSSSAFVKVPETDQFVSYESFVIGSSWDGLSGVANGTCVSNKVVGPIDDRAQTQVTNCNSGLVSICVSLTWF
ncbi:hypothetical protein UCRNP2_6215 [Neofusicoccum parvum UCRNP2]|uniref:Uncharacterized protein n=1 Tax=Botryosphaeria parva (strain UCR-NP2) TaxID=1287680 RepID=R1EGZ6_BOTPV|nr:hypothetical protein UCRNP2_6215 [Neofusicoccum parvum UCRNP2]